MEATCCPRLPLLLADDDDGYSSCSSLSEIPDFSIVPSSTPRGSLRLTSSADYSDDDRSAPAILEEKVAELTKVFERMTIHDAPVKAPKSPLGKNDEEIYVEMRLARSSSLPERSKLKASEEPKKVRRANTFHGTSRPLFVVDHLPKSNEHDFLPLRDVFALSPKLVPFPDLPSCRDPQPSIASEYAASELREANLPRRKPDLKYNVPKPKKTVSVFKHLRSMVRSLCPLLKKKPKEMPSEGCGNKGESCSTLESNDSPMRLTKSAEGGDLVYFDFDDPSKKKINATY
ncbi:hypothetical protein QR680_004437 [Steinernema hermaphroditum]|uniref:Uncharacterized protein n=1 Tax=Steinernema hermaphroditum TaxID=289476 RepID=A0AA39HQX5_9BILA|nr:hypothetical protein QR680_004437 [Steinernema hermaphroditum]